MASKLLQGFEYFRDTHLNDFGVTAERPTYTADDRYFVVACADPRVAPEMIFWTPPDHIFSHRTVAAVVGSYDIPDQKDRSLNAKLRLALNHGVKEIIVIGHEDCRGMDALVDGGYPAEIMEYVEMARSAMPEKPRQVVNGTREAFMQAAQGNVISLSAANLATYPAVRDHLDRGTSLSVRRWLYDPRDIALKAYNPDTNDLEVLNHRNAEMANVIG